MNKIILTIGSIVGVIILFLIIAQVTTILGVRSFFNTGEDVIGSFPIEEFTNQPDRTNPLVLTTNALRGEAGSTENIAFGIYNNQEETMENVHIVLEQCTGEEAILESESITIPSSESSVVNAEITYPGELGLQLCIFSVVGETGDAIISTQLEMRVTE